MTKQFIHDRYQCHYHFHQMTIDLSQLNLCSLAHLPKKELMFYYLYYIFGEHFVLYEKKQRLLVKPI